MEDAPDVRLVDAHPEGDGRHDTGDLVAQEGVLGLGADLGGPVRRGTAARRCPPGRAAPPGARCRPGAARRRWSARDGSCAHQLEQAAVAVVRRLDAEGEVRAARAGVDEAVVRHAERGADVGLDGRRGRRGQREHRRIAEIGAQHRQAQVVRAEVVAPGADAVGLVHGQQRHPDAGAAPPGTARWRGARGRRRAGRSRPARALAGRRRPRRAPGSSRAERPAAPRGPSRPGRASARSAARRPGRCRRAAPRPPDRSGSCPSRSASRRATTGRPAPARSTGAARARRQAEAASTSYRDERSSRRLLGGCSDDCTLRASRALAGRYRQATLVAASAERRRRVRPEEGCMRAVLFHGTGKLEVVDRPSPALAADEVRLRVERSGICGSDIATWKGDWPSPHVPSIKGHEVCGSVLEVGSAVERRAARPACGGAADPRLRRVPPLPARQLQPLRPVHDVRPAGAGRLGRGAGGSPRPRPTAGLVRDAGSGPLLRADRGRRARVQPGRLARRGRRSRSSGPACSG